MCCRYSYRVTGYVKCKAVSKMLTLPGIKITETVLMVYNPSDYMHHYKYLLR